MRLLSISLTIAIVFLGVGCYRDRQTVEFQKKRFQNSYYGCWHMFVPKEEDGPHHEYYEIREDNSVVACFLTVDRKLIAKFGGRLEKGAIVSKTSDLRFPIRRDGDFLIIRGKKDFVFSRIDHMPEECE